MKPTNLENGRIVITIPIDIKKQLFHRAIDEGLNLNSYIAKILTAIVRREDA